jgi:hypothetical protein
MDNMAPVIDDDDVEELRQMRLQLIQAEKVAQLASPPPGLGDADAEQNSPPPQFLVHKRDLAS